MAHFTSSGGVGDSFISLLHILENEPQEIIWDHFSCHEFYKNSINQLMSLIPNLLQGNFHTVTKDSKQSLINKLSTKDTIKIEAKVRKLKYPIKRLNFIPKVKGTYAIIQPVAGRNDASLRSFSPHVVLSLAEKMKEKYGDVLLLGQKFQQVSNLHCNLTGSTTVAMALRLVMSASYFIGLDGFLAYAAMSAGVPSSIIYHDHRLLEQYCCPQWEENNQILVGPPRVTSANFLKS